MGTKGLEHLDATLKAAWHSPEALSAAETWLTVPRSEAATAQYAYLILKKHFDRAGVEIQHDELPASWFGFAWLVYGNLDVLLREGTHSAMLRELLQDLVRFTQAFAGAYFTDNLYELLRRMIEEQKLRPLLEPLLPPEAFARLDELQEMLWRDAEDARRRADEGSY